MKKKEIVTEENNEYINRAKFFLLSSLRNGLACSFDIKTNKWVKPYPEITGYLLSLFSKIEENLPQKIIKSADRLISIQDKTGGFSSFFKKEWLYTFDTGQIMNGLLDVFLKTKNNKYLEAAVKAADFLLMMQLKNGAMFPIYDKRLKAKIVYKRDDKGSNWGSTFSYIQLKNCEGLLKLYKITKEKKYLEAVDKLVKWGKKNFETIYTHPLAYFLEGMLAVREKKLVKKIVNNKIIKRIEKNGFIGYYPSANYAYVSGSIQLGIVLYLIGYKKEARKIRDWARMVQQNHYSGGLFQYANKDGSLNSSIHSEINTWGTKYFIELEKKFLCTS